MEKLYLTEAQKASPVWVLIERHIQGRLDDHRRKNDDQPSEAATQKLRGRIAELKALLEIASDPPTI
jgi:hypothetical protein